MASESLPTLKPDERDYLLKLYKAQKRTSDDLPYTPEMDEIHQAFNRKFPALRLSRRALLLLIKRIRKVGGLPVKGR